MILTTDTSVTIALIAAVASFAASTVAAFVGLANNYLARRNEVHMTETKDAVNVLKEQTDGIKDQLVKVTGEAEYAKGLKQGTEDSKV